MMMMMIWKKRDFELIQMNTDSLYLAIPGNWIDQLVSRNYEKSTTTKEKLSFYKHQNTKTELQDYSKLSSRARE